MNHPTSGPQVYLVANGSGSAGKTTLALALADQLATAGTTVCVVDVDPQGNATTASGADTQRAGIGHALDAARANDPDDFPGTPTAEVLAVLEPQITRLLQDTPFGYQVLGAGTRARAQQAVNSLGSPDQQQHLTRVVRTLPHQMIIIDSHGDLGNMTRAAIRAADHIIAVTPPAAKETKGIPELIAEVDQLRAAGATRAQVDALVPTMVRARERVARVYLEAIGDRWGTIATPTIRFAAAVGEATLARQPITAYDPASGVAADHRAVYDHLVCQGVLCRN